MATGKKYYWLKLNENFFQQKEIKSLRKIAGGDTYTVIYLKMLLKSLKSSGFLYYDGIEDNFVKELALDIDEETENVAVTVKYLFAKGILVEQTENEFQLLTCKDMVGSRTTGADRTSAYRQRQKLLKENNKVLQCNTDVTKCNTEKREKKKEIELDLKKEKDKKEKSYSQMIDEYTNNEELKLALLSFVDMRKTMKGFTKDALKLNLNKLDKLASNIPDKIQIVENSIEHTWKGFYALKTEKGKPIESKYNVDEIEYKDPEF